MTCLPENTVLGSLCPGGLPWRDRKCGLPHCSWLHSRLSSSVPGLSINAGSGGSNSPQLTQPKSHLHSHTVRASPAAQCPCRSVSQSARGSLGDLPCSSLTQPGLAQPFPRAGPRSSPLLSAFDGGEGRLSAGWVVLLLCLWGLDPGGSRPAAEAVWAASGPTTDLPVYLSLRLCQLGRQSAYCHNWHALSISAILV